MKICLYKGALKLVEKSGVGQAISHQEEMLKSVGIEVVDCLSKDIDFVHINTIFPDSILLAFVSKLCGKKVIYYGHSTMEDFRNSFKGSNQIAFIFKKWIKFCYGMGDLIITPTDYSKSLLESYGIKKPIVAMSNGIDTDFFYRDENSRKKFREIYQLKPNEKAVISVGHYIERKGILEFIHLAEKMPETRFFWFGYTNLSMIPNEVKTAICNAPANLCFPGYVSREKLKEAYAGCDLFVFMSFEETEGIVVLEALSSKIPVLVRNIPVYNEWLENGKNVYKAATEEEFFMYTKKILQGSVPDLTQEGRKTAEERSIHTIGKNMMALYQNLKWTEIQEKGM